MSPAGTPAVIDVRPHRGAFFRVLAQTPQSQVAVMTVAPGADAGPEETHAADQIVYVVEGEARVRLDGQARTAGAGTVVLIPAGTPHHVRNDAAAPLFFLTVYAPPEY